MKQIKNKAGKAKKKIEQIEDTEKIRASDGK
jgi:hypothetical protein